MAIKEKRKTDEKRPENLLRRKGFQVAVVAVVSVLLTLAYIWFIHRPLYAGYTGMKAEHEKLAAEVAKLRSEPVARVPEAERQKAREESGAARAALDAIRARFLAGDEGRLGLLSRVNEIAGKHHLEVKGVEPLDEKALAEKVKDLPAVRKEAGMKHFSMTLKGRYGGLLAFMDEVSGMDRLVALETVSIRQQEDGVPLTDILLGM